MVQKLSRIHPETILASLRDVAFVCPLCRGELDVSDVVYRCEPCGRTYPLHGGIPDFRVFADPYLDFEQDFHRTELVLAVLEQYDLPRLLEYYWSHSDITPPDLRAKFIRNALLAEPRGRRVLHVLENGTFRRPALNSPAASRRVLEVGSGTGNFLVAAAGRYEQVIGTDIAMRWLHISRRRCREAGLPEPALVCCCAEYLPFPDAAFDLAVSSATLEFTREPGRALAEGARVLRDGGSFFVNTANRYSIAVNPYAYLWGVGFLPRAWQPGYVRWRRQTPFDMVRVLSLRELKQLAAAHFTTVEIALPDIDDESLRQLPPFTRLQVKAYRLAKRLPLFREALRWVGPQWDVLLGKGPAPSEKSREPRVESQESRAKSRELRAES